MANKIKIFLQETLPEVYLNPTAESGEKPVADIEELITLYNNKYHTFGEIDYIIYKEKDMIPFIVAMNQLFKDMGSETKVDAKKLKTQINQLVPMIVVDGEIVSRGVYPDLTKMRGGSNSISRGGTGHHEH